uniref:Uncharacterized protein n=1 Tax=Molossus molossus TaxID=27622 RepID=A0A7J8FS22_MOLMO|nr:hypothetical protein HJG59_008372 [Molossus molossus]
MRRWPRPSNTGSGSGPASCGGIRSAHPSRAAQGLPPPSFSTRRRGAATSTPDRRAPSLTEFKAKRKGPEIPDVATTAAVSPVRPELTRGGGGKRTIEEYQCGVQLGLTSHLFTCKELKHLEKKKRE